MVNRTVTPAGAAIGVTCDSVHSATMTSDDPVARVRGTLLRMQLLRGQIDKQPSPAAGERRWLLWDQERGAWWRPNRHGYTTDVALAGRYERGFAEATVRDSHHDADPTTHQVAVLEPSGQVPIDHLGRDQLIELLRYTDTQLDATGGYLPELLVVRGILARAVGAKPRTDLPPPLSRRPDSTLTQARRWWAYLTRRRCTGHAGCRTHWWAEDQHTDTTFRSWRDYPLPGEA